MLETPDHATIARFVERHEAALAELFGQVLGLCARAGLARPAHPAWISPPRQPKRAMAIPTPARCAPASADRDVLDCWA